MGNSNLFVTYPFGGLDPPKTIMRRQKKRKGKKQKKKGEPERSGG